MAFSVMPCEDRFSGSHVDSLDTDILVRPKSELQSLLLDAGADKDLFTMKEVLFHLGQYIMQKQLFDLNQQHIVHCAHDALGKVLGVDSFSIKEPRGLFAMITKNLTIVSSEDTHSTFCEQQNQSQKDSGPQKLDSDSHSSSSEKRKRMKRTNSDPAGTSLAGEQRDADDHDDGSKRHRSDSFSLTFDDSLSWCVIGGLEGDRQVSEPSDAYSTESGSVLSEVCITGHSSDDCVSSLESDSDNFSVEFEVESIDSEDYSLEEDASLSGEDQIYEVTIIEDTDEDTEISEADYWRCPNCEELNPPLPRNCNRCWTLRNDWLPDSVISNSASNLKTLPPKPLASQQTLEAEDGLDVPDGKRVRSRILFSSPVQEATSLSDSQCSVYLQDSQTSSAFSQDILTSSKPCSSSPKSVCTFFSSASHLCSSLPYSSSLPSSGLESSLTSSSPLIQQEASAVIKDLSASAELSQSEVQCDALSETPELEHFISMEARLPDSCLEPCVICQSQPKNGCIVHGRTGHIMACYSCARKLKRRNKMCPVCREPIESVVLTYLS